MTKIAVVDIETTGLDPCNDLIIEIGIVELNLHNGQTQVLFDSLVREQGFGDNHRNSWIFLNSNVKFEEVKDAPPFESVRLKLERILDEYPVTAFNKSFDLGFLKARGINVPNELPCIMRTATNICKIPFPTLTSSSRELI